MPHLWAFAASLVSALALTPAVREWARRTGFVDRPARRKVHAHPIPLGGGLAIAAASTAGIMAGVLAARDHELLLDRGSRFILATLAGLVLIAGLGFRDDRKPLGPIWKLAGQTLAAALLIFGSGRPEPQALAGLAIPLALVAAVALMNACNFLDNMDGVLSGIALVCAAALVAASPIAAEPFATLAALAAASTGGAAAGFLAFNFPPARVFMGDAGSLALGFLLAAVAVIVVPAQLPLRPSLGLLLILGYPFFDLTFVTVTRIADGRKVWTPGKDHTSHRLHRLLKNGRRTALVLYALTSLSAAAGVAVCRWPSVMSGVAALAGGAVLVGVGVRLARVPPAA